MSPEIHHHNPAGELLKRTLLALQGADFKFRSEFLAAPPWIGQHQPRLTGQLLIGIELQTALKLLLCITIFGIPQQRFSQVQVKHGHFRF